MGLFGPLDSLIYPGGPFANSPWLYRFDSDATGYNFQPGVPRPLTVPNSSSLPSSPPAAGTTSGYSGAPPATAPVGPPAPPMPSMQALGTFTTRRTQLFGPLGSVSI